MTFDKTELLAYLKQQIHNRYKRYYHWADHMNVSAAYVSQVLNGDRPPSPAMLDDIGIEVITIYRVKEIA